MVDALFQFQRSLAGILRADHRARDWHDQSAAILPQSGTQSFIQIAALRTHTGGEDPVVRAERAPPFPALPAG